MKRPSRKNPIITPTQRRSTITFELIVTATTYLLESLGWNEFTSNDIAEKAGVNINSFYQYFLNREAAVLEVTKRLIAHDDKRFSEMLTKALTLSETERVSYFIDHSLRVFEHKPKLRRAVLVNIASIMGRAEQVKRRLRLAQEFSRLLPERLYPTLESRVMVARVVVHTFIGVNVAFLMEETETAERTLFQREIKHICEGYIFNQPTQ